MKIPSNWLFFIAAFFLTSCSTEIVPPKSEGEKFAGFTYIPINPLPVEIIPGFNCHTKEVGEHIQLAKGTQFKSILDSLPDNAVRMTSKEIDASGNVTFSPASMGSEGKQYQVVLDYVNVDTANTLFHLKITRQGDGILQYTVARISDGADSEI